MYNFNYNSLERLNMYNIYIYSTVEPVYSGHLSIRTTCLYRAPINTVFRMFRTTIEIAYTRSGPLTEQNRQVLLFIDGIPKTHSQGFTSYK